MFGKHEAEMKEMIHLLRIIRDNTTPRPLPPVTACMGEIKKGKKKAFSKKEKKSIERIAGKMFTKKLRKYLVNIGDVRDDADELSQETAMLAKDTFEISHALVNMYTLLAAMIKTSKGVYAKLPGGNASEFTHILQSNIEELTVKPELIGDILNDSTIIADIQNMIAIDTTYPTRQMQTTEDGRWWIKPDRHDEFDEEDEEDDLCCAECKAACKKSSKSVEPDENADNGEDDMDDDD